MAIRFDAAADRLLRTSGLLDYQSAYTWMAWVYLVSDLNDYGIFYFVNRNTNLNSYDLFGLDVDGTTLFCIASNAAGTFGLQTGGALSTGTWYHVALVRSSTTALDMYLNGAASGSTNTQDISGRSAPTREEIGAGTTTNASRVNARVAAEKVWTAALTATEIAQELNCIRPARFANLWRWAPLIGSASDIADYSGNARDWTASGTLTTEDGPPVSW